LSQVPHPLNGISITRLASLALGIFFCSVAFSQELNTKASNIEPTEGVHTLELEELWRIGGIDDEENLLGVVNKVLADDQGNIYLMDIQLNEVQVFDEQGEYFKTLGGPGDGPGEVRRLNDMIFMPDGTLGLVQGFPGKIIQVDMEGLPAGEFHPGGDDPASGGFFALRAAASLGNRLVMSGARISRQENSRTATNFIAAFGIDQNQTDTYHTTTNVRQFRGEAFSEKDNFFPHEGGWALAEDGRVYVAAERNEYSIQVFSPKGALERNIERQYESWKRTDEELQLAKESAFPFRRRNRRAPDVVVEATQQDIIQLRAAENGQLWVLPSRGIKDQPAGIHSTWDVFDREGVYRKKIRIACPADATRDALFFVGQDLLVLVKEHSEAMTAFRGQGSDQDEPDVESDLDARPLEVVCYQIKK